MSNTKMPLPTWRQLLTEHGFFLDNVLLLHWEESTGHDPLPLARELVRRKRIETILTVPTLACGVVVLLAGMWGLLAPLNVFTPFFWLVIGGLLVHLAMAGYIWIWVVPWASESTVFPQEALGFPEALQALGEVAGASDLPSLLENESRARGSVNEYLKGLAKAHIKVQEVLKAKNLWDEEYPGFKKMVHDLEVQFQTDFKFFNKLGLTKKGAYTAYYDSARTKLATQASKSGPAASPDRIM